MMAVCSQKQKGFTIVELLIVVIVVAILAAVSVVAYTNIQNRASDSAVQADIRNFVGKVKEFQAMNGRYPRGAASAPSTAQLAVQGIPQFSLAHGAYSLSHHNFYYSATDEQFAVGPLVNPVLYFITPSNLD